MWQHKQEINSSTTVDPIEKEEAKRERRCERNGVVDAINTTMLTWNNTFSRTSTVPYGLCVYSPPPPIKSGHTLLCIVHITDVY